MRDTPDISMEELKLIADKKEEELPGIGISLLPILLPVILIAGNTILGVTLGADRSALSPGAVAVLNAFATLGDSNIALFIAAFIALYLLWRRVRAVDLFKKYVSESLVSAGVIVLITAAGGAFGQMLQQTGIGSSIEKLAGNYQMAILPLAFLVTAVVRTAQGSATVAMVTAIGVIGGLSSAGELAFHPVYLALVIGCGSKIFAWMNDSGYWVVSTMSGMNEVESMRHFSYLLTVMALAGLVAVMILAAVFPMV